MVYDLFMKRYIAILVSLVFTVSLFLPACSNQEQAARDYNEGYQAGFEQGHNQGFTEGQGATSPKVYVGSVNSDIYHYPSCEWQRR